MLLITKSLIPSLHIQVILFLCPRSSPMYFYVLMLMVTVRIWYFWYAKELLWEGGSWVMFIFFFMLLCIFSTFCQGHMWFLQPTNSILIHSKIITEHPSCARNCPLKWGYSHKQVKWKPLPLWTYFSVKETCSSKKKKKVKLPACK